MIDDCFALGKPVTVDMKHTAALRMASLLLLYDQCIMKLLTACQSVLTAALPVDDFLTRRSGYQYCDNNYIVFESTLLFG